MTDPAAGPFSWHPSQMPDQTGRVAVVTGASSGLGAVVAETLARHGSTVVMGVRDPLKGERVRNGFGAAAVARTSVRELDLADLQSVARFAADVRAEHHALHLLVNNAGTGRPVERLSAQGFQATFATNHLGHFALTGHLLPLLERADAEAVARVISVGSNLYRRLKVALPLDDLTAQMSPGRAYVASKLAVLVFAVELDRRLRTAGSGVRSVAAHPGVAATPMQQQAGSPLEWLAGRLLGAALSRSAEAGAIPLLYAATAPTVPSDRFLGPSLRKRDRRVHADALVGAATDADLAVRLWSVSEQATGVRVTPAANQAGSPSAAAPNRDGEAA